MPLRQRVSAAVPVRLRPGRGHELHDPRPLGTACGAPSIQLRLDPNGVVTSCCKTLRPLGHVSTSSLREIWDGARRHALEDALIEGDFSVGCERCGAEIEAEGRAASYAAYYDEWTGHLTTDPASRAWPTRMEMNLSNACNLQCIQCDGDSSSAIRVHREGRAPLPKVYGDAFFDELRSFLPHLERIVFGGGEPFLAPENFRVWDLVAEINPAIDCQVITNATQWTPRVEKVLSELRLSFIFSLDGITRRTFEEIRVGADFDRVMANIDRFIEHTRQRGSTAMVNHCLMPQNHREFGALLRWAEDRGLFVNVSVVRFPAAASIARLPADQLRAVLHDLEAQDDEVRRDLSLNLRTWDLELGRIRAWAESGDEEREPGSRTIMFFRCDGTGPHDDLAARAELAVGAFDGRVHVTSVGEDDLIRWCDVGVVEDPERLVGQTLHQLTKAITSSYGEMNHYEVVATSDDRVDARAVFGEVPARITSVAMRAESGWADEVRVIVAFDAPPPR